MEINLTQKERVRLIMILKEVELDLVKYKSYLPNHINVDDSIERIQESTDIILSTLFVEEQ